MELVVVVALVSWFALALVVVGLCVAAARGDELSVAPSPGARLGPDPIPMGHSLHL
jgi:hypothetical protein